MFDNQKIYEKIYILLLIYIFDDNIVIFFDYILQLISSLIIK